MKVEEWLQASVKRLEDLLPPGTLQMKEDLKKNIVSLLKESLGKLDVVSREEFDAQTHILQRTQQTLQALEKRLRELEQTQKKV
jgi:hypothetical protein